MIVKGVIINIFFFFIAIYGYSYFAYVLGFFIPKMFYDVKQRVFILLQNQ